MLRESALNEKFIIIAANPHCGNRPFYAIIFPCHKKEGAGRNATQEAAGDGFLYWRGFRPKTSAALFPLVLSSAAGGGAFLLLPAISLYRLSGSPGKRNQQPQHLRAP